MGWAHWVCGQPLGCPYIHCNPFVHSSNKACSLPRLLRHSGSGLGVLGGYGGAMHRQRQAPARWRRIAISWLMHLFSFESTGAGGPRGCPAPVLSFLGVQGYASSLFPVPVGNTGTRFLKKPLNQRLIFFLPPLSHIVLISF